MGPARDEMGAVYFSHAGAELIQKMFGYTGWDDITTLPRISGSATVTIESVAIDFDGDGVPTANTVYLLSAGGNGYISPPALSSIFLTGVATATAMVTILAY